MTSEEIANEIIKQALQFVDLYEIKSNADWHNKKDPDSDEKSDLLIVYMKAAGWQSGWPYCASLTKAIWMQTYKELDAPSEIQKYIKDKLTPSVMTSFNNCKKDIVKTPKPGAIFFMQKGTGSNGHAGIVVSVNGNKMSTIEGNTSPAPTTAAQDREGDGIYKKVRTMDFTKTNGLWLRGFLNPITW